MKVLSIQQPWAHLICLGIKDVENRTWNTKFRGDFLIHASQKFDSDAWEGLKKNRRIRPLKLQRSDFKTGGIIGTAKIVDCVKGYNSYWTVGGQFQFVLEEAHFTDFCPCKGSLGFWELNG